MVIDSGEPFPETAGVIPGPLSMTLPLRARAPQLHGRHRAPDLCYFCYWRGRESL